MVVQNGLLMIQAQKNKGNAKVPMNDRIKAILDRYNGELNIVALQKLNEAIKELAQKLKLDYEVYYYRHKLKGGPRRFTNPSGSCRVPTVARAALLPMRSPKACRCLRF